MNFFMVLQFQSRDDVVSGDGSIVMIAGNAVSASAFRDAYASLCAGLAGNQMNGRPQCASLFRSCCVLMKTGLQLPVEECR